jgi:hypothetical protein
MNNIGLVYLSRNPYNTQKFYGTQKAYNNFSVSVAQNTCGGDNIFIAILKETRMYVNVKCLLFLPDFNQIGTGRQISVNIPSSKLYRSSII